jgi:flagellar hook-basal body complex protein FliE
MPVPIPPLGGLGAVGQIAGVQGTASTAATAPSGAAAASGSASFGGLLQDKLGSVVDLQQQADQAAQAVASGQSSDLAGATTAVAKSAIALQLVGAVRNKALEAYQDVMRMQV